MFKHHFEKPKEKKKDLDNGFKEQFNAAIMNLAFVGLLYSLSS